MKKNFIFSLVARFMGLLLQVITIPVLYSHLNHGDYALWCVLMQFGALSSILDLGIGNGVVNYLLSYGSGRSICRRIIFASHLLFLCLFAVYCLVLLIIYLLFYNYINHLFPYFLFFFVSLMNLPVGVIQKIEYGFNDNYLFHIGEICTRLIVVCLIYVGFNWFGFSGLTSAIIIFYGTQVVLNFINCLMYYKYKGFLHYFFELEKYVSFFRSKIYRVLVKNLVLYGRAFFLLTIFYTLGRSFDNLIIRNYSEDVLVLYDLLRRPFLIFNILITALSATYWTALAVALRERRFTWVYGQVSRVVVFIILLYIVVVPLYLYYYNDVMFLWIGHALLGVKPLTVFFIGVTSFVESNIAFFMNVLNSFMLIKYQACVLIFYSVVSLFLKCYLIQYGLLVFVFGNFVMLLFLLLLPMVIKAVHYMKRYEVC